jgi:hypothetical protein
MTRTFQSGNKNDRSRGSTSLGKVGKKGESFSRTSKHKLLRYKGYFLDAACKGMNRYS